MSDLRRRLSTYLGQTLSERESLAACAEVFDTLATVLESTDMAPLSAEARNEEACRILTRIGARIRDLTDDERDRLADLLAAQKFRRREPLSEDEIERARRLVR